MGVFVWQRTVVDESGTALPGATVTVTDVLSGALTQLYSDSAGASPVGNPISTDSSGFVQFYVKPGIYDIVSTLGANTRTWDDEAIGGPYKPTADEISAGVTPVNSEIAPYNVDRYFLNTTPGTTNATTGIQAAIDATPTGGKLTFGKGPYLINANAIVFDKKMDTHFDGTVFYCPATAGQVALQWGVANTGWFNTEHTGRFEVYRASAGGTLLPTMNGSQTAASQLLGTGVKFLNFARGNFALSTYVFGFQYGHHWESENGAGMTLCRYEFLEGQNNLIDFFFKPVSDGGDINYVTALTISDFMTTFNNAHYSSIVGTRFIEIDKNGESVDGLRFYGGTVQNVKEYKLVTNATECVWRDIYWDQSTATEEDIWLKSGSSMNIIESGAGQRLQSVLDEGTLNSLAHPFYHQKKVVAGYVQDWFTYSGTTEFPFRALPVATTLSDDGFYELPTGASGIVAVSCGDESGLWGVTSAGATTKLSGTTNTAANGNDAFLSVYDVGTNARVINRLGSSLKTLIWFLHWV